MYSQTHQGAEEWDQDPPMEEPALSLHSLHHPLPLLVPPIPLARYSFSSTLLVAMRGTVGDRVAPGSGTPLGSSPPLDAVAVVVDFDRVVVDDDDVVVKDE